MGTRIKQTSPIYKNKTIQFVEALNILKQSKKKTTPQHYENKEL